MMQKWENPELLRRYLLGDLDERQQEEIEEQLLSDEKLHEDLSDAEDHLIDDYVMGILPGREHGLFDRNFLITPERLHKLRVSQALLRYAGVNVAESHELQAPVTPLTVWQGSLLFIKTHWLASAVSAVAILMITGYIGLSIYRHRQLENRLAELRTQRLKVEGELARLNAGQPSDQQAITTLTLKQRLVRDARENRLAVVTEGINILQLRLGLDQDEFFNYQAVIETDEGLGLFTVNNLRPTSVGAARVILLNLPSRLLPAGSYQVRLSATTSEEKLIDIGTYPFQVVLK